MNRGIRESADVSTGLKRVIWCDGLFELVLGLLLATATLTHLDIAPPLSPVIIVGFGILLLPVGFALLVFARSPNPPAALGLALANACGAVIFAAWLARWWPSFTPVGQLLVAMTTFLLALFAGLEFVLSRASPTLWTAVQNRSR